MIQFEYLYTAEEEEFRNHLIDMIDQEKQRCMDRIDPYIKQLSSMQSRKVPKIIFIQAEASHDNG